MARKTNDPTVDPSILDKMAKAVVRPRPAVPTPSRSFFDELELSLKDHLMPWQTTLAREKRDALPENTIVLDFLSDIALNESAANEGLADRLPLPDGHKVGEPDLRRVLAALAIYERVLVARDVAWRNDALPGLAKVGAVEIIDQLEVWRRPYILPQMAVQFDWLRHAVSTWTSSGRNRYGLLGQLRPIKHPPMSGSGWTAYWLILETLKTGSRDQLEDAISTLASVLDLEERVALAQAFQARKYYGVDELGGMIKTVEGHFFGQHLLLLAINFATAIAAAAYFGWPVLCGVDSGMAQTERDNEKPASEEMLRAYRISAELTHYVPEPRTVHEACEFRSNKNIKAFRTVLSQWAVELKKGEAPAIERMKRDIELVSRDLRRLGRYRQLSRLVAYASLPLSLAGALMALPLGLIVTPFGIAIRLRQDSLERATRWTMLGQ